MTDTYETIIHKNGEIVLEATLDRDEVIEALEKLGPSMTYESGEPIPASKIMALAVLADGFWTYQGIGIMIKRSL